MMLLAVFALLAQLASPPEMTPDVIRPSLEPFCQGGRFSGAICVPEPFPC